MEASYREIDTVLSQKREAGEMSVATFSGD